MQVCQANIVLKRRLDSGRFYDFTVEVRNQRGSTTQMNCSFHATNSTTPIENIFPGAPSLLMVSENSRRNTELGNLCFYSIYPLLLNIIIKTTTNKI